MIGIRIDPDIQKEFKCQCKKTGLNMSQVIKIMISRFLKGDIKL